jgi:hypothetical protein
MVVWGKRRKLGSGTAQFMYHAVDRTSARIGGCECNDG